ERRKLDARLRQLVAPEADLLAEVQQGAPQSRRLQRRQQLARLDDAGFLVRAVDFGEQRVRSRQQALRGLRTPPGNAHVVHQRLHRLAAALLHDQDLVGKLLGAKVTDAEIEQ